VNFQRNFLSLFVLLLLCLFIFSCNEIRRERVDVISSELQIELNNRIQNIAATDSLRIFDEVTYRKDTNRIADILHIRLFGSKTLPADNNKAEKLAMEICKLIYPLIPRAVSFTLFKVQFVKMISRNEVSIQKVINFLPREINPD